MRFGLIKFCIPLDFSVLNSVTNSGVDDRYGLFKELIRRGHEVFIFTPLVKGTKNNPKEEKWILNQDLEIPKEMEFVRKMWYVPGELPVGEFKVDVLIAEAGVGNFQYPNPYYTGKNPELENSLIRRFAQVINAHKGPVFYMHCDPSLPFYFRQMAGRIYPWGHKKNGYTNPIDANRGSKWVRDSGWGTYDEMFKDKTSVVLTRCLPSEFEFMLDNYDSDRAGYREYSKNLQFEYVPPAYAYDLCKGYDYKKEMKYPLFYSGGDRRRRRAFRKFYEEMGVPTFVSGKWTEEAMSAFDDIDFLGWLEDRQALLDTINESGCVVQIQPKDASRMGWWTARTMEVPACKAMCFIDGSINRAEDMVFDKWFVLKNKDEASRKIQTYLSMSLKDRIKIIETQLAYCKTYFTWKKFVDSFMLITRKYVKSEVQRTIRKPSLDFLSMNLWNIKDEKSYLKSVSSLKSFKTVEKIKENEPEEVMEKKIDNKIPFKDIPKEAFGF